MSITYTLPGFPTLNQLHESTADGQPDENASWNCVAASIADGLGYLTGRAFDGDELKDAVYGQGYQGAQAPARYVDYCAEQGVQLVAYNGTPSQLVARIHDALAAGHPVVGTIPSQWGTPRDQQRPGYTTHVVCFCGDGPGMLRADNPWIAPAWHDGDDQYWADRLCFGQVWVMAKAEEEKTAVAIIVPSGWKDDGKTLTAPNGKQVTLGFRDTILTWPEGWPAFVWPAQEYDNANESNLCLSVVLHWQPTQPITTRSGALPPAPPAPQTDPKAAAALQIIQALHALEGQL